MTIREVVNEKISKRLQDQHQIAGIKDAAVIELKGEDGGRWFIDCRQTPPLFREDQTTQAPTLISMETSVFEQMMSGELSPQSAFLSGKVKVEGDLGVAIKLGQLLI